MKGFFQKKQWLTVALVAALGLAIYLNYYMGSEPSLSAGTRPQDSSVTEKEPDKLGEATFVGGQVSKPEASQGDASAPEKDTGKKDYFDQARDKRTAAREEALGIIQEVLDSEKASAEDKALASKQATAIAENVLKESRIENLIAAKGFGDSVVYLDGKACSVVVKAEELKQQESLQILEMAVTQAGVSPEQVQILTSNA